ncbi:MAG: hypothetical protein V4651_10590 [Bacteroidota bacterium]
MNIIRYCLLISMIFPGGYALLAQTKPAATPNVYKSKPIQPATPRIKTQQSSPVANPNKLNNPSTGNPRVATSKDSVVKPVITKDPNEPVYGGLVNIGLAIGVPRGEFKTNTNGDVGIGFDVSVLANLGPGKRSAAEWNDRLVNVYVGGAFQYMRQSGNSDQYSVSNYFSETSFESKVVNNMYALNVVGRIEFLPGYLKLFGEASAGGRLFSGVHKLHVDDVPYSYTNPDDRRTEDFSNGLRTDIVGNYALGGGLRVGSDNVKVELKVMYLWGTSAEYVDMHSIQFNRNDNSVTYSTRSSTTNMIIPQLSISLGF